jgi:hypothetical protein
VITHKELRAILKKEFPTLKKWFGESVFCFDPEYQDVKFEYIQDIFKSAFQIVQVDYEPCLNDCENHATGVMWHSQRLHRQKGGENPIPLGMFVGENPSGLSHAFNIFVADNRVYIGDYGKIFSNKNYKPHVGFLI